MFAAGAHLAHARDRFVKSTPQKFIANGTDWRFLGELKRELKE